MITFGNSLYEVSEEEPKRNDLVIDGNGEVGYLDYICGAPVIKDFMSAGFYTHCINPMKLVEVTEA